MRFLATIAFSLMTFFGYSQRVMPIDNGKLVSNLDGNRQAITNLGSISVGSGTVTSNAVSPNDIVNYRTLTNEIGEATILCSTGKLDRTEFYATNDTVSAILGTKASTNYVITAITNEASLRASGDSKGTNYTDSATNGMWTSVTNYVVNSTTGKLDKSEFYSTNNSIFASLNTKASTNNVPDWDASFMWGNHALAGYLLQSWFTNWASTNVFGVLVSSSGGLTALTNNGTVTIDGSAKASTNDLNTAITNERALRISGDVASTNYINLFTNRIITAWQNPSSSTNWTWTKTATAVTLTGYTGPNAVVIPDVLDNLPVTGFGTIFNTKSITSITGGANVTAIVNDAFLFRSSLVTVSLPAVTTLGVGAFAGCANLTTVLCPLVTSVGGSAFSDCTRLNSVTFSKNAPIETINVYSSSLIATNYIISSTATGWGSLWNGQPVVRLQVYSDRFNGYAGGLTGLPMASVVGLTNWMSTNVFGVLVSASGGLTSSTNNGTVTIDGGSKASTNSVNLHTTNSVIHITGTERTNWNNKAETTITNGLATTNFVNEQIANIPVFVQTNQEYVAQAGTAQVAVVATTVSGGQSNVIANAVTNNQDIASLGNITTTTIKPNSDGYLYFANTNGSTTNITIKADGSVFIRGGFTGTSIAPLICQNTNIYANPYTQFAQVWLTPAGLNLARMRADGAFLMEGRIDGTYFSAANLTPTFGSFNATATTPSSVGPVLNCNGWDMMWPAANTLTIRTGRTNALTISPQQYVGIGTTTPVDQVSIVKANDAQLSISGGDGYSRLFFKTGSTYNWSWGQRGSATFTMYDEVNSRTPFTIEQGAPSYSFYMRSTGNLGIGIQTPSEKLHVNGNVLVESNLVVRGSITDIDGTTTNRAITSPVGTNNVRQVWQGTTSNYLAQATKVDDTAYLITDDTTVYDTEGLYSEVISYNPIAPTTTVILASDKSTYYIDMTTNVVIIVDTNSVDLVNKIANFTIALNISSTNAMGPTWSSMFDRGGYEFEYTVTGRYEYACSLMAGGKIRIKQTYPTVYQWSEKTTVTSVTADGLPIMGAATNASRTIIKAELGLYTIGRLRYKASSTNVAYEIYAKAYNKNGQTGITSIKIFPTGNSTSGSVIFMDIFTVLDFLYNASANEFVWIIRKVGEGNVSEMRMYSESRPANELEIAAYLAGWRP